MSISKVHASSSASMEPVGMKGQAAIPAATAAIADQGSSSCSPSLEGRVAIKNAKDSDFGFSLFDSNPSQETFEKLIKRISNCNPDEFRELMQERGGVRSLLNHSRTRSGEQKDLAIQIAKYYLEQTQKISPRYTFRNPPKSAETDTLSYYTLAMHYLAKAISIAEKSNQQVQPVHKEASQLFTQIFKDYLIRSHGFKEMLENAVGHPNRDTLIPQVLAIIQEMRIFCYEKKDEAFIQELIQIAKEIHNQKPSNVLQDAIKKEGQIPFTPSTRFVTQLYREKVGAFRKSFLNPSGPLRAFQAKRSQEFQQLFTNTFLLRAFSIPFCKWDLRAAGSTAREERLPFSDLEPFLLIEDGSYSDYFKFLGRLLELQFISLGETVQINMPVFTYLGEENEVGLHIDPLAADWVYTPQSFARVYAAQGPILLASFEHSALRTVSLAASGPELAQTYQKIIDQQNPKSIGQTLIQEALSSYRQLENSRIVAPNKEIALKKAFTELLHHGLAHLALYFGFFSANTLDLVRELKNRNILSSGNLESEIEALYALRLKYKEKVSLSDLSANEQKILDRIYRFTIRPLYESFFKAQELGVEKVFKDLDLGKVALEYEAKHPLSLFRTPLPGSKIERLSKVVEIPKKWDGVDTDSELGTVEFWRLADGTLTPKLFGETIEFSKGARKIMGVAPDDQTLSQICQIYGCQLIQQENRYVLDFFERAEEKKEEPKISIETVKSSLPKPLHSSSAQKEMTKWTQRIDHHLRNNNPAGIIGSLQMLNSIKRQDFCNPLSPLIYLTLALGSPHAEMMNPQIKLEIAKYLRPLLHLCFLEGSPISQPNRDRLIANLDDALSLIPKKTPFGFFLQTELEIAKVGIQLMPDPKAGEKAFQFAVDLIKGAISLFSFINPVTAAIQTCHSVLDIVKAMKDNASNLDLSALASTAKFIRDYVKKVSDKGIYEKILLIDLFKPIAAQNLTDLTQLQIQLIAPHYKADWKLGCTIVNALKQIIETASQTEAAPLIYQAWFGIKTSSQADAQTIPFTGLCSFAEHEDWQVRATAIRCYRDLMSTQRKLPIDDSIRQAFQNCSEKEKDACVLQVLNNPFTHLELLEALTLQHFDPETEREKFEKNLEASVALIPDHLRKMEERITLEVRRAATGIQASISAFQATGLVEEEKKVGEELDSITSQLKKNEKKALVTPYLKGAPFDRVLDGINYTFQEIVGNRGSIFNTFWCALQAKHSLLEALQITDPKSLREKVADWVQKNQSSDLKLVDRLKTSIAQCEESKESMTVPEYIRFLKEKGGLFLDVESYALRQLLLEHQIPLNIQFTLVKSDTKNLIQIPIESRIAGGLEMPIFIQPDRYFWILQKTLPEQDSFLASQGALRKSIEDIHGSIQQGIQQMQNAQAKSLFAVIGPTGAGKSTTINGMAGCTMALRKGSLEPELVVVPKNQGGVRDEMMPIGHKGSHTFIPQIEMDPTDSNIAYGDCPGFFDDRGAEKNIANAANIRHMLALGHTVRLLVQIEYSSLLDTRGRTILDISEVLRQLFGSQKELLAYKNSLFFAVTKVPPDKTIEAITKRLSEISPILAGLSDRIVIYDPIPLSGNKRGLSAKELLQKMTQLVPISNPKAVFHTVLIPEAENKLNEMAERSYELLELSMKQYDFKQVRSILSLFSKLEVINHRIINQKLDAFRSNLKVSIRGLVGDVYRFCCTNDFDKAKKILDRLTEAALQFDSDIQTIIAIEDLTRDYERMKDEHVESIRQIQLKLASARLSIEAHDRKWDILGKQIEETKKEADECRKQEQKLAQAKYDEELKQKESLSKEDKAQLENDHQKKIIDINHKCSLRIKQADADYESKRKAWEDEKNKLIAENKKFRAEINAKKKPEDPELIWFLDQLRYKFEEKQKPDLHGTLAMQTKQARNWIENNLPLIHQIKKLCLYKWEGPCVPEEILELVNLEELELSGRMKTFPAHIGHLIKLKVLKIEGRTNYGFFVDSGLNEIAPEIGNLKNLVTLEITSDFVVELPKEIANLQSLEKLKISGDKFKNLSSSICKLTNLWHLEIFSKNLKEISKDIGNLKKLEVLFLTGVNVSQLPIEMKQLVNLKHLKIDGDVGEVAPEIWGNFPNLNVLQLEGVYIGKLPLDMKKLANLKNLIIHKGKIDKIPDDFFKATPLLEVLDLHDNRLSELPESMEHLTQLKQLICSDNYLKKLPKNLIKLGNLSVIKAQDNRITHLDEDLSSLPMLRSLVIYKNSLKNIPEKIKKAQINLETEAPSPPKSSSSYRDDIGVVGGVGCTIQ